MNHELYRYYDADDALLYVGISKDSVVRHKQHASKYWHSQVVTIKVERHESRELLESAERAVISREMPMHNKQRAKPKEIFTDPNIEQAIRFCGGTQNGLASMIGGNTTQGHVHQWLRGLKKVSPEFAALIEMATEGHVTRLQIRPDVFGKLPPLKKTKAA